MNALEYRARLERLGLTAGAAALLFRVGDRTHRYWASGDRAIPGTVGRVLDLYDALLAARRFIDGCGVSDSGRTLRKIEKALS